MENSILIYLTKVSLLLAIFYLLYKACFARDTFFKLRRTYLLFALLSSLVLPFGTIEVSPQLEENIVIKTISEPLILFADNSKPIDSTPIFDSTLLIGIIALLGSLFMLTQFIIHLLRVARIIDSNNGEKYKRCRLIRINNRFSSFSFFRTIFIDNTKDRTTQEKIIEHEYIHAVQYHSIDIILIELLLILCWWNPFLWLLKREIKINHEYLADKGVLDQGFYKKDYQYTLLNSTTENTGISIINFFNVSQLNKRITMMNKKRTLQIVSAKYLLIIPILGLLLVCNSLKADIVDFSKTSDTNQPQKEASTTINPEIAKFIKENLRYPVLSQENGTAGLVTVSFIIDQKGSIKDVKIEEGLDERIDKEVVRVIKAIPQLANYSQDKDNKEEIKILFKLVGDKVTDDTKNKVGDIVVIAYR